jgi:uncharacterized protein
MIINRDLYLNKLVSRKNNGMIKVITGIRRSGKSFLLFNIFKNYLITSGIDKEHIIELNFDSFENEKYHDSEMAFNYLKSKITDDGMYYMLLDEIQLLDKFESILNSFLRLSNVDIYVTGSNAKFLSKDVITEFRGRGDQIHIFPLSFSEFYNARGIDKRDAFEEYIVYGGLPLLLSQPTYEQKVSFLKNLFVETYIKDIVNRNNIDYEDELKELINILSSSIGSLTNPNKLTNTFKSVKNVTLSAPTISKYIEILVDSFIINRANRYDVKGKSYIDTPSKYYFSDLGLRNAAINFRQTEKTHLLENVIYNELLIRGYSVDVGIIPVVKKINSKAVRTYYEIDFVCNKADKRIYIQSSFSLPDDAKYQQEARSLLNVNDSFTKIIISGDATLSHYTEDGIMIMNIFDFLLKNDSLNI